MTLHGKQKRSDTKNKILLIGATGTLGKSVLGEFLKEPHFELAVLVRNPSNFVTSNITLFTGDVVLDKIDAAIQWADIVVNCSGFVSYQRGDKCKLIRNNVEGVRNLVNSCIKFNKPLIHTSSAIVYGSSLVPIWFNENNLEADIYRGNYAQSKLLADRLIMASDMPYVILRPGTLISTLTKLYKFYQKGFVADLKGGASFAQLEEVSKAYVSAVKLLQQEPAQYMFNLGGQNLKFSEVFERFKSLERKETRIVKREILHVLSFFNDYFLDPVLGKSILTRENYLTGSRFTFIDSSKAIQDLNYIISPFEQSLNNLILNDYLRSTNSRLHKKKV